ncbi:MAG: hypothetical protein R3273_11940 [Pseudidiomarina maritima]|nr:hypothetical protein [Pseudidiomarina maritima]
MHPQAPLKFCYQALTTKGASYYRWWVIGTVLLALAAFVGVTAFEMAEWLLFLTFGLAGVAMIIATLRLFLVKLFEENADAINLLSSYFPSLLSGRSLELASKITNAFYYGVFYLCCYLLLAAIFLFPLSLVVEYAKS